MLHKAVPRDRGPSMVLCIHRVVYCVLFTYQWPSNLFPSCHTRDTTHFHLTTTQ